MDSSNKSSYYTVLGKDILKSLGLNLNFSKQFIKGVYRPFEGSIVRMVDLGTYEFKYLNAGKITPK